MGTPLLVALALGCALPLSASASILPAQRDATANWKMAGMQRMGGIPHRTTVCATLRPGDGTTDDSSRIQSAIKTCPPGEVLMLGPGKFIVDSYLLINKGLTLRGSGAGVTLLVKTNGARPRTSTPATGTTSGIYRPVAEDTYRRDNQPIIVIGPSRYPWGGQGKITQNLAADGQQGATSVSVADAHKFHVGEFVFLDELTGATWQPTPPGFPGGALVRAGDKAVWNMHNPGQNGDDPPGALSWFMLDADRPTNETKEIVSISGSKITFSSPLTTSYRVSHQARIYGPSPTDSHVTGAGVESLSMYGGADGELRFERAAYSWGKNLDVTQWIGEGVAIEQSFRVELRDSYIHAGSWPVPGGGGYAISVQNASSEVLLENNISMDANKVMVFRAGGAGSVVGYNYTDDGWIYGAERWPESGINASHMVGPHHVLFEGNYSSNAYSDFTHGNATDLTFFRNWVTGARRGFVADASRIVALEYGSWRDSFIGNVLGRPGQMRGYHYTAPAMGCDDGGSNCTGRGGGRIDWSSQSIWMLGYDGRNWSTQADPKVLSSVIRDGNYDYLTRSQRWHNTPPGYAIPKSLYLSSKPAFFGSCVWPWVDPSTGTTYVLPAKARFDTGAPNATNVCGDR